MKQFKQHKQFIVLLILTMLCAMQVAWGQTEGNEPGRKVHIAGSALYNLYGNNAKVGEALALGYQVMSGIELNVQGGYFSDSPAIEERYHANTWFASLGMSYVPQKSTGFCMVPRLGLGVLSDKQLDKKWKMYFATDLNVEIRYYLCRNFFSGLSFSTTIPLGKTDSRINGGLVVGAAF